MPNRKLTALVLGATLLAPQWVRAEVEIQWWHSMTGALSDRLNDIANKFNAGQTEFKVVTVFKGTYMESMPAAIAAFRAKNPPHIVQIFEVGTATMMAATGAIKPVYQVMAESGEKFDPKTYMPAVSSYYTDATGRIQSMPFNSSTTVFYYNKDAFRKAGLDPAAPPKTWAEVGEAAKKIKDTGTLPCGYTSAWQSWVQLENASAWHNVAFASKDNGFGGMDARLMFNNPLLVRHIAMLGDWAKDGRFTYAGRTTEPQAKFHSSECAMITGSSASYAEFKRNAKFEFGVSTLPYHADVKGAPQNSIIGGASLWVFAGKSKEDYRGVAKFFSFLSSPEVQADWHQATGYVPITTAAYELSKSQGFYEKNPGTDVAIQQLLLKNPTKMSKGVRLGNLPQIRDIIDQELEAVWSGQKTAKAALDEAVKRGDEELRKFERANRAAK
jgi:sn-glycerol 3-phosphate transport system substrate-binding protein